jgi:predicted CXXCH cytochrome family protein
MSEHEPNTEMPGIPDSKGTAERGSDTDDQRPYGRRVKTAILQLAAVFGTMILLVVLMTGGAAHYTSQSHFCASCHIMEPYYVSWQESTHHDVACIKCHFPPGAGEKVRGKLQGLVQLLKYVTETAGPRLAAEIPDESCLRCHDTRLLSGRVEFQGMPFDHAPHLADTRRGKKLRCTSCHSQIVQGEHMSVTSSTCFLCHFKDGALNEGIGTCTRCHQIPEETFDLGGGVMFTHELAYERGIDCASCHSDVVRGNGEVPPERCTVCHNRPEDLQQIDDHEFIHQKHVTDHKIDCLDCHLEIHHSADPHKLEHAASDCASCHPNQHRAQIHMLRGEGSKIVGDDRGSMALAGITCLSCHQAQDTSVTGAVLWRASTGVCTHCHDDAATERLLVRHEQIKDSLADIEAGLNQAREATSAADLDVSRTVEVSRKLDDLGDDLEFLRVGNSIHNMHYADTLLHSLVEHLQEIHRELEIEAPTISLPDQFE